MATVHIDNNNPPVEREVIREPVATDNGSGTALLVLAILVIAIIAAGAYFYYMQTPNSTDTNRVVTHITQGAESAGSAVGDAAGKVTRSTTTTTSDQ